MPSPVALFVYNRPDVLSKTLESLAENHLAPETTLYIFSDGPKICQTSDIQQVAQVRELTHQVQGFREVHIQEQAENIGLAESIIQGVSDIAKKHESFIVIEDDMICAPNLLNYMDISLTKYKNESRVWCINGMALNPKVLKVDYPYDNYFLYRNASYCWGSWSDRWQQAVWDEETIRRELLHKEQQEKFNRGGNDLYPMMLDQIERRISSWAIRWSYSISRQDGLCLTPKYSYVKPQESNYTATHVNTVPLREQIDLSLAEDAPSCPPEIEVDHEIVRRFARCFHAQMPASLVDEVPEKIRTPEIRLKTLQLGTEYGGWEFAPQNISESAAVYSFGLGYDISFDLALIRRYGLTVHGFDPTPKSIEWLENQELPKEFILHPYGIAAKDGAINLHPPKNPEFISHTIQEKAYGTKPISVPVKRLSSIMEVLGHQNIDILKMDIEGAEYEVIQDICDSKIRPRQILVEFHHRLLGLSAEDTIKAIQSLQGIGYKLYAVSKTEYSFIHSPEVSDITPPKIKIAHLTGLDSGGAYIAAKNLGLGLQTLDYQSDLYTQNLDQGSHRHKMRNQRTQVLDTYIRGQKYPDFVLHSTLHGTLSFAELRAIAEQYDIIHLHWLHGLVSHEGVAYLSHLCAELGKALVYTTHDMNLYSGACHYFHSCNRWQDGCTECPQYIKQRWNDIPAKILAAKKKYWKLDALTVISLSAYSAKTITQKSWLSQDWGQGKCRIQAIGNAIDIDSFRPQSQIYARKCLKLPPSGKLIAFFPSYHNHCKGITESRKIYDFLQKHGREHYQWVVSNPAHSAFEGTNVHKIPFLRDRLDCARLYAAADVVLVPSLEEVFPNTVGESLACGTPVVGFEISGLADMIQNAYNGYIVPVGDIEAIGESLIKLLEEPSLKANCRSYAEQHLSVETQARAMDAMYQEALEQARSKQGQNSPSIPEVFPELAPRYLELYQEAIKIKESSQSRWDRFGRLSRKRKLWAIARIASKKLRVYPLLKPFAVVIKQIYK